MSDDENFKVVELKPDQLEWSFDNGTAAYRLATGYRTVKVDPFPAYGHVADQVSDVAARVTAAFPVGRKTTFFLLSHEHLERTNGWTDREFDYSSEERPKPWLPYIVLSGKRIPIHPAMTRYLVAHEYGHVVAFHLSAEREDKDLTPENGLYRDYAELRGLTYESRWYGGGTWHAAIAEIFANDFRLMVTQIEPEFWPHDVPRPETMPALVEWWANANADAQGQPR